MARTRPNPGQSFLLWRATGFVALVCVAILALSGWREWSSRQIELTNAEIDMANLARSLTQHADDSFEIADTMLVGMVNRIETDGVGEAAVAKLQNFLQQRKAVGRRIRGIFVYGEAGQWLATTEAVDRSLFNNSDRDYFRHHRASTDRETFIGKPVRSRSGGQWIVTASRRFNHPDGSFGGVVLTTIDVAYFSEFYQQFDVGPNGSISLLSADGILLARNRDADAYIGRDLSSFPLIKSVSVASNAGVYYFTSPLDGQERLSFYRLSSRFPLLVLATKAKDEVLATWRREALLRLSFVAGLTLLLALIGAHLVRQLHARQRMEAMLASREADFRLLAEHSSDMVTRIGWDEQILYISPSCSKVIGWDPDQLIGTPALAGVNPDDLPRVRQAVAALKFGSVEEAKIIYRSRHRLKGEVWVETALRVTRAAGSGAVNGVVGISRDMTQHKDLEDRLAALAASDALTGLANRRCFDERLEEEWERARREKTPISLLLIDIDYFKKFNDHYGHQAGDDCLRSVGRALATQAQRPADLAARYGGEEFVLLLPNTDAEGCERVGERIRQALKELGVAHALNPPWKRVTASVGGATSFPAESGADCASLIETADRALYVAKDSGRDRLVMSGRIIPWPSSLSA